MAKRKETQPTIPDELMESPGFLLNMVAKTFHERVSEGLKDIGLTLNEYGTMRVVSLHGPLTQQALSRIYNIDRTTVVQVVDALEKRKLVERTTDPADRRCNLLSLTPGGRRLLSRSVRITRNVQNQLLEPLDEKEWRSMQASLVKLMSSFLSG